jgi:hypothetical protein
MAKTLNNSVTDVGFAVIYEGERPSTGQLLYALCDRLVDLLGDDFSEADQALWDPWDTHEEDADLLWQNGIDITPELTRWEMRVLVRTMRQVMARKRKAA